MDPKACLDFARHAISSGEYEDAAEHLMNYFEWRMNGGFEAEPNGDGRFQIMICMLAKDADRYRVAWEGLTSKTTAAPKL